MTPISWSPQHRLRPASEGWVRVPEHHHALWAALQVERRPLTHV